MKMKSLKITHFFDVVKKEPIFEDQHVVPVVEPDLNHVKQEYHYKEELDVTWDERDNDYGMGKENYDVSNGSSYKLGFPIVLIERLPDDIVSKSVQRQNGFENAVPIKRKNRGFLEYYQKFCTECKKREPSEKKTNECKNCDIRWNYECKNCNKKLSSYGGIVTHLITKCLKQGHYYKCFKCNYKSIEKQKVNTHLKNVHSTPDSLSRIEKIRSENVQSDVIDAAKLHKCSKCSKQFQKLPQLLRHIQTCGQANCDSKSFVATVNAVQDKCLHHCVKCNLTVKNDEVGSFHQKKCQNCHSNFSFECKICNQIYKSYVTMHRHLKTIHTDAKEVFKCPECDYETFIIEYLTKHVRRTHFLDSHECLECGKNYKNRTAFKNHLMFCQKEAIFQCDYCSHKSKTKMTLKTHIFQVHVTGNEIDCPQCGITMKNKNCLKVHMKYCKKEPHYLCKICPFKTKYKYDLKTHCESVHSGAGEKEICPNCAKECKNKHALRCHVTRCGGKLPELSCKFCHRLFKGKSCLRQHIIRAHSDVEIKHPYLHCDDCSYKTKFKGDLVKHITIHQENNAKECTKCKKYFKNGYFQRHAENCGKEPLRCDCCDFHTLSKECLRRHIYNRHSKGNEIDCSKCGRTYKNKIYLRSHMRRCGTQPHLQCNHCSLKTKYKYHLKRHIEKFHTKKRRLV